MTKNSLDHNGFEQESLGAQVKFNKALASQRLAWGLGIRAYRQRAHPLQGADRAGGFRRLQRAELPPPPPSAVRSGPLTRSVRRALGADAGSPLRLLPDEPRIEDPATPARTEAFSPKGSSRPSWGWCSRRTRRPTCSPSTATAYKTPMYDNAFSTPEPPGMAIASSPTRTSSQRAATASIWGARQPWRVQL